MKIRVSNGHETLRTIANSNRLSIEDLIALNPHIAHPDQNIPDKLVYLPEATDTGARSDSSTWPGGAMPESAVPGGAIPTGTAPWGGTPAGTMASGAMHAGDLPTCPIAPTKTLNNWIPLTPLPKMAEEEYDVLIIGTGAGGGAVLWRLCEQWKRERKRIGIIDRGNQVIPTHARNVSTMNEERLNAYFTSLSKPLPGSEPDYTGARQLFALGGRTLFWYTFTPRLKEWDLAKWPIPVHEMESYYGVAEEVMNVTPSFAEGASFTEIVLQRLWMSGYSKAAPLPIAADIVPSSFGQIHTDVFTSSISLLAKALNLRPFDLAINARAVQILHHNGKAIGAKVVSPDRNEYTLKAKTVVVCASTFETPRLLLYSGLHNRALGRYFTNQTYVQAAGSISTLEFPIPWGPLNITIPQTPDKPYTVLLTGPEGFYWYPVALERPITSETTVTFYGFGKVEPRYENGITLNPNKKDEYGIPEIQVHFSLTDADRAVVGQMAEGIRRIAADTGIRLVSRDGKAPVCLTPFGFLHHDSGTCRIGNDPATSVADPYGQVRGVSGLFVADNSALPYIGAENQTLTTIAFAIRTADHIARTQR